MHSVRMLIKAVLTAAGLLLILVAVILLVVVTQVHRLAGPGLSSTLSRALDAPVEVGGVTVHPMQGTVILNDVMLGNPEVFGPGAAVRMDRVTAEFDLGTILSKTPTIRALRLANTRIDIHHEATHGVNLLVLTRHAKQTKGSPSQGTREAPAQTSSGNGEKHGLIIQKVTGDGAQVTMASNLLPGSTANIKVDAFAFDGTRGKAASVTQVTALLLENMLRTVIGSKGLMKPLAGLLSD